jgi:hypothetical protein
MKRSSRRILALAILASTHSHGAEPLFFFDLNKVGETQPNAGVLKTLSLRLINKENQLTNLIGPSGSGVTGENWDRCAILEDGACMNLLEGKGGQPLLDEAPAFTFSGWIKSDSLSETNRWPILVRNLATDNTGGLSLAVSPEGKPILAFGSSSGNIAKTELLGMQWLKPNDEWQFFAIAFGDGMARFYSGSKDEPVALVAELTCPVDTVPTPPNPTTGLFGQHGGSDTLHGHVDNLRLFDADLSEADLEEIRKNDVTQAE